MGVVATMLLALPSLKIPLALASYLRIDIFDGFSFHVGGGISTRTNNVALFNLRSYAPDIPACFYHHTKVTKSSSQMGTCDFYRNTCGSGWTRFQAVQIDDSVSPGTLPPCALRQTAGVQGSHGIGTASCHASLSQVRVQLPESV